MQCTAEHPNADAIVARGEREPTRCNESRGHRGPHRTSFGRLFALSSDLPTEADMQGGMPGQVRSLLPPVPPGPADTVLHADNYGHGPAYTLNLAHRGCDTCATIADRAAEARHGGRYITEALARAIDNDVIRSRFAGAEGPEALAEIWRYSASPSGSNYPASGRDTTARYAIGQAANGGVEWTHSAYWRPPMLPEAAFDWPVYRAAMRPDAAVIEDWPEPDTEED